MFLLIFFNQKYLFFLLIFYLLQAPKCDTNLLT